MNILDQIKRIGLINDRLGYGLEALTYLQRVYRRGPGKSTKFVIFGTGRSGSTLLVNLLNSNPNIFCDNEIFHRKTLNPKKFLDARVSICNRKIYGFKLLTYQLDKILHVSGEEFIHYLNNQGFKIIHLVRNNSIEQAISNIHAKKKRFYHQKGATRSNTGKLRIEIAELDRWYQNLQAQKEYEKKLLQDLPRIQVTYEQDLTDGQAQYATIRKISTFLDTAFVTPKTDLVKIIPKDLSQIVENYGELLKYCRSKGIEHLLLPNIIETASGSGDPDGLP